MEALANTTREESNKKRLEVGDPSMEQMEEKEKNLRRKPVVVYKWRLNYNTIYTLYFLESMVYQQYMLTL